MEAMRWILACSISILLLVSTANGEKHALLVGCSKYPNHTRIEELAGTENDVANFQRLLRSHFKFDEVRTLVGWPEDEKDRPTYDNICREFEQLIEQTNANDQVMILMAGHGFRFPLPESQQDVLDPANPEPDGFDESFLPADYEPGGRVILDNQIGQWLDRFKERGVHVWIVFDSCFSGTMTRGGDEAGFRRVDPSVAGVDLQAMRNAERRAVKARSSYRNSVKLSELDVSPNESSNGSVVAFYAAQDYEPAPEVTRPAGADEKDPKYKHGLLSFHLERLLRDQGHELSYAALGRALVSRYRSDGRRWPTPAWEGDLERQVFGVSNWPEATGIYIEKAGGQLHLRGGELAGLSEGTIVGVYRPSDHAYTKPLAHLRVMATTSTSASVESITFGDTAQFDKLNSLPENSVCRIVSRPLGESRVAIHVRTRHTQILQTIRDVAKSPDAVFYLSDQDNNAEWVFMDVPNMSDNSTTHPDAVLLPTSSTHLLDTGNDYQKLLADEGIPHVSYSAELMANPDFVGDRLSKDINRIIAWRNLWRLAGEYSASSPLVTRRDTQIEVRRLAGPSDHSEGTDLNQSSLKAGDTVLLRVVNKSYEPYWYVVFFLNKRCGIQHVITDTIRGRNYQVKSEDAVREDVLRFAINEECKGTNGFVVIAVSVEEHPNRPNYALISQDGLGSPTKRGTLAGLKPTTLFEETLSHSIDTPQLFRSSKSSPDNPQISSWSWVTESP